MRKLLFIGLLCFLTSYGLSNGQTICKNISVDYPGNNDFDQLRNKYGKNKILQPKFERQSLIALSYYPELEDTKIVFRYKKKVSPLLTRPTIWSAIFRSPAKRKYVIIISNNSKERLDPLLLEKMPFNAQIGVLGHELSHVSYFVSTSRWGMLKIAFGNLSPRFLDHLEYQTDQATIDHGLGYQLLAWSEFVRNSYISRYKSETRQLQDPELEEAQIRERYMHPSTIRKIIKQHPLYDESKME